LTPSIIPEIRSAGVPIVWTLHDFKLICPENSFYSNGRICEECKGGRFYRCAVNRCKKSSLAASAMASAEAYVHTAFDFCRGVDCFVAPSKFLKRKFEEFGWTERRIDFVRNFLPDLGVPAFGGRYGVFTGMLRPVKGVATLLRALALAGDPPFYIAGDGTARPDLEALAHDLGLTNTKFLGHLAPAALKELVNDARYAVVPSEWYENCPYAVLEAMAAGKPVIATDLGGLTELIEHEHTGLLFALKNAAELAAMIGQFANDAALAERLGRAARAVAEREFSPAAHYVGLSELYDDVHSRRLSLASVRA
jgi:glycosyltransferase involved in cell wall biosynthesis